MSAGWSWFVIILTVLTMVGCVWLIFWTNKHDQQVSKDDKSTGHQWDGLTELNNTLPMWWLGLFVGTIIFSGIYLAIYPGLGNFAGLASWNQAEQYESEMRAAEERYGPIFAQFGSMEIEELATVDRALAIGKSLYANYCAQCHGSAGRGAPSFPNLTDDEWVWGGQPAQIEHSILKGRVGFMPPMAAALGGEEKVDAMVEYVRTMASGPDTSSPTHSQYVTLCGACHGPTGDGMALLGAPRLNDDNWLYGSSPDAIRRTIVEGRRGVMPAHEALIGKDRARILTAYVYSLSRKPE